MSYILNLNPSIDKPVYIQDPNVAINVSADVRSPNSARPCSADTMLLTKLNMLSSELQWLLNTFVDWMMSLTLYLLNFSQETKFYLWFITFLQTDMTPVVEILSHVRQELTYSTQSISWMLMSWRWKEPGHQQPWYWLCWTGIIRSLHICPPHIKNGQDPTRSCGTWVNSFF